MGSEGARERIAELRGGRQGPVAQWVARCVEALLEDADACVRAEATALLALASPVHVLPPLIAALGANHRVARRRAAAALARMPRAALLPALGAGAASGSARGRRGCVDLLGRIAAPPSVPLLAAVLGDSDPALRARAVAALGHTLSAVPIADRRSAGRSPTADYGAGLRALSACAQDPDERVRAACARALGRVGDPWTAGCLISLAAHTGVVGHEAHEALARLPAGVAVGASDLSAGEVPLLFWSGAESAEGETARLESVASVTPLLVERLRTATDPISAGRLARGLLALGPQGHVALAELLVGTPAPLHVAARRVVLRWLLEAGATRELWAVAAEDPDRTCRALALRGLLRAAPREPAAPGLQTPADDELARWLLETVGAVAESWTNVAERRVAAHCRATLPSACPPYGLPAPSGGGPPPYGAHAVALGAIGLSIGGNIGLLMRTAEAAGVRELFLVGDPSYHPGAARGADHWIRTTWLRDAAELVDVADASGYGLVGVQQSPGAQRYDVARYPPRPLLVVGCEATGLPAVARLACDLLVEIPLAGQIDSLNVAVAASVVLFECLRRQGSAEGS